MQEGQDDFITNKYRVDIQYRGTEGAPPNAIQWRVLYGSSDDLDVAVRARHGETVRVRASPESLDHLSLESHVGQ